MNGGGGGKIKSRKQQARRLYRRGLSVRKVAAVIGCGKSAVWDWVRDIGRTKEAAWAVSEHRSYCPRACRMRARAKVERSLGRRLLSSEQVHHKDCDYTNDRLENLEVLTPQEHIERHRQIRRQLGESWMPF